MEEKIKTIENIATEKIKYDEHSRIIYREITNNEGELIDSDRYKYFTGQKHPIGVSKYTHGDETVHEIEFVYNSHQNVINFFESGKLFAGYTYGNYIFEGLYEEYENYDDIFPEEHYYRYDDRHRLISECINGEMSHFIYDNSGNIKIKSTGENTYVFEYHSNKLKSVAVVCGSKIETAAFAYDANGLPRVYRNCYLNCDNSGRLTEFDGVYFSYDESSNRKTKNDTYYEYDDGKLIKETHESDFLEYFHGLNGMIAFKFNDKLYYYIKNPFGDVSRIADENNNIVAEYRYDAFGNHKVYNPDYTENTSTDFIGNINPIRYRGYYYDTETKLYFINNRYYDSDLCRYVSPDPKNGEIFKPNLDTRFKI